MHPINHARSSASAFGGHPDGHLPFHAFLDQTKMACATVQHRVFLHSADLGLALAQARFGTHIDVGSGLGVSVEAMMMRHLDEDLGIRATLADWLRHVDPDDAGRQWYYGDMMPEAQPFSVDPAAAAAVVWGGDPEDYRPLTNLLKLGETVSRHPLANAPLMSSVGPFLAEQCLGAVINLSTMGSVPTRVVAERMILGMHGTIEPASRLPEAIPLQDWMRGKPVK